MRPELYLNFLGYTRQKSDADRVRQKNSSLADSIQPWKGQASGPGAGIHARVVSGLSLSVRACARSRSQSRALLPDPTPAGHHRGATRPRSQPGQPHTLGLKQGLRCRCWEGRGGEVRTWVKRCGSFQSRRVLGRNQLTVAGSTPASLNRVHL